MGNALITSLVWTGKIEVVHLLAEHPAKLTFVEDEEVIQALPADTAEEALAARIGSGGTDRSLENCDASRCGNASQLGTVRAVVIAHAGARCLSKRGGFTEVLGDPFVGRMPGHPDVDNSP